jgi:hypothetical protein
MGKPVEAVLQSRVNRADGTFDVGALEFNGVPQNAITRAGFLAKMYETASLGENQSIGRPRNNAAGKAKLLDRDALTQLVIGKTKAEISGTIWKTGSDG